MLPSELRRKQKEEDKKPFIKKNTKISNSLIESEIIKYNQNAIKVIFYLASLLEKEAINFDNKINSLVIDTSDMFKYIDMSSDDLRKNLKSMQKTSISFVDNENKTQEFISLLPYIKYHYNKNKIEIDIYSKVAKLIIDVKKNYTFMNTKTLMSLKNKHSLRLLPVLNMINQYSDNVAKRKTYKLEDLNSLFGTKYKKIIDVERFLLKPIKEDLDMNSKLTFIYDINYIFIGVGRPKADEVVIDLKDNSSSLFAQ